MKNSVVSLGFLIAAILLISPANAVLYSETSPVQSAGKAPTKKANKSLRPKVIQGELTPKSSLDRIRKGRYSQAHKVRLEAGTIYQIDMESRRLDACLRLEDDRKRTLAEDDDSGDALNARLVYKPSQSGDYWIIATTYLDGETGDYTLTVAPLGSGNTIRGVLTGKDPFDRLRPGRRANIHPVPLTAGKSYQFDLRSLAFDTFLRLENSMERPLDQNDDGGASLNSRIQFTPKSDGTYRIIVTSYLPGQTGAYTLTIRELSKSAKSKK